MALQKTNPEVRPADEKAKPKAYVNWVLPAIIDNEGNPIKSTFGFPIHQNTKFPNKGEDTLMAMLEKHVSNPKHKFLELNMTVRIYPRKPEPAPTSIDDLLAQISHPEAEVAA